MTGRTVFLLLSLALAAALQAHPARAQARMDDPRHGPGLGQVVRHPPPGAFVAPWRGVDYRHFDGIWYRPGPHGWVVVSPPVGVWVSGLPPWAVTVVIGGFLYWRVDSVYYRARDGGYEVVTSPPAAGSTVVDSGRMSAASGPLPRQFVYPRQGQDASLQASDKYACHRWAVDQTHLDPSAAAGAALAPEASGVKGVAGGTAATGTTPASGSAGLTLRADLPSAKSGPREDYLRALAACLEGRGYTVR
ncbi:DUF6515 family protein [Ideonella livida]|uniref:Uncharacterized protein n=1 Tax=Ideonella livida TaxID=2707176 RepID=A0A7C9TJP9_9BURK|nr:DUF6515 family protein [Ideonella livida]NDY91322.1 hypothetical protein [Ideonella livida]